MGTSFLDAFIIQRIKAVYIKITLQVCYKRFILSSISTISLCNSLSLLSIKQRHAWRQNEIDRLFRSAWHRKSTLAEAMGRELNIPVFAKDWLEATLVRSELKPAREEKSLGFAGYELLTTLAERQLMLGQSVILDSVAASRTIRYTWQQLTEQYDADRYVIECICSDESLHRSRLKDRKRSIPGWHELDWSEMERVRRYYLPWEEKHLVLDMTKPFEG